MSAYAVATTPIQAINLVRETLAESTAIASGAHDWDFLDAIQGIAYALQALNDLEAMAAKNRWRA